jgi:hypothetical protein
MKDKDEPPAPTTFEVLRSLGFVLLVAFSSYAVILSQHLMPRQINSLTT